MASKKFDFVKTGVSLLAAGGGYIAGKALNNIPIVASQNAYVRGGGKIAIGVLVPMFFKKGGDLVEKVALGLAINGVHEIVGTVVPSLAGIPFARPLLLRGDVGALEGEGALGALEGQGALGNPGQAGL